MEKLRVMSTTEPIHNLTYQEWVDELRIKENVIVSSKYHARTIEQRIRIEESLQLQREMENSEVKISDGTAKPRILVGMLKSVLSIF